MLSVANGKKLQYWLPRTLLCAILFFGGCRVTAGQFLAPWIWLLFSAWMI